MYIGNDKKSFLVYYKDQSLVIRFLNIVLCDIFFIVKSIEIEKYVFDITRYNCCKEFDLIFKKLETAGNEISN